MPKKRAAGRLIYAASENCADLLYATGFMAPDPLLWFRAPGVGAAMLVNVLELGRARKQVKSGVTVFSETEFRTRFLVSADTRLRTEVAVEAVAKATGVTVWQVPDGFPLALARRLEACGLTVEPVADFFPERLLKTEVEVESIRAGVQLAERGLERALALLHAARADRRGVLRWRGRLLTAEILRGEIAAEICRYGGNAAHTIAAPGVQGADPHLVGEGPVRAGEPIVLDIFPRVEATGYFGDLTRTVVKGQAPAVVRRAFAAVQAAQRAAFAQIRAGVSVRRPHRAAEKALRAAGFRTQAKADPPRGFFHGLGHGLGLEVHEGPRVSGRADGKLVAGHVVTVEPGLYYPEWGGIRLEDVVVVTATGCRNLTTAPVFLEIP